MSGMGLLPESCMTPSMSSHTLRSENTTYFTWVLIQFMAYRVQDLLTLTEAPPSMGLETRI